MKKRRLLNDAAIICKFFCLLVLIALAALALGFVYWHINPEYFSKYNLAPNSYKPGFGFSYTPGWVNLNPTEKDPFVLSKLTHSGLYFIYFQISATLILTFLSLKEGLNIVSSVKLMETFRSKNIVSFQKIARYQFFIFILSSFIVVSAKDAHYHSFHIAFMPLGYMVIAYVLAEIFKEGKDLHEENQLTV